MRGQTAVEYLMTYGWAILIILIVAGVLAYYGIFAPAGFLAPTARGFGQVQVLNPWSIDSVGLVTLNVENRVGGAIDIYNVSVTIDTSTGECDPNADNFASGTTQVISCDTTLTGTTGNSYTATVTIKYYYPSGTTNVFASTGTLSGTYS